jgi:rhamnulokinase/L-fuculokinase
MVGGGTQSDLLCRLTANVTGRTIIVGSSEATAQGNIALQLMVNGEIGSISQARQVIANTEPVKVYEPANSAEWSETYARYMESFGE